MTSDVPEYNTHAVAERTDIPAATFIAWERRYGIPKPHRTANDRRLYSEHDIAQIVWLRDRTAEGLTISQAVSQLPSRFTPEAVPPDTMPAAEATTLTTADIVVSMTASHEMASPLPPPPAPAGNETVVSRMVSSLSQYDERAAGKALAEFVAIGTTLWLAGTIVPQVLASMASLVETGNASPASLRFAQRFLTRKLEAILEVAVPVAAAGLTIVAGITAETPDTDVLIEAIRLASQGQHLLVLGTDVSLTDLVDIASWVYPDRIALVASTVAAGRILHTVEEHMRLRFPHLHFVGSAFGEDSSLLSDVGERGSGSQSTAAHMFENAAILPGLDITDA